jgi:hypothetical protein
MTCPYCGRRIVQQLGLQGPAPAREDYISVCGACRGICVLHDGVLCRLTPEEIETLRTNPELRTQVAGIIRGLLQVKHLRS